MEAQRSLETVESCSPHSQLLAWPEFQGLTLARWGPGLASLERPHSVLGSWGLSLADSLLISHMHVPQEVVFPAPRNQDPGLASGPKVEGTNGAV